jgi:hypothetical protein
MGKGNARLYNMISLAFVTLSVIWVIVVIVMMVSG